MAYRRADAYRHEFTLDGTKYVTLRVDERETKWTETEKGFGRPRVNAAAGPIDPQFPPSFESFDEATFQKVEEVPASADAPARWVVEARFKRIGEFASARLGIEDGTWLIRTIEYLDAKGETRVFLRFKDINLVKPVADSVFQAPKAIRDSLPELPRHEK
jgi:hypothetical protein